MEESFGFVCDMKRGEIITKNILTSLERTKDFTRVSCVLGAVCSAEVSFKILAYKRKKNECFTKIHQKNL